jgi:hypothetical protein
MTITPESKSALRRTLPKRLRAARIVSASLANEAADEIIRLRAFIRSVAEGGNWNEDADGNLRRRAAEVLGE